MRLCHEENQIHLIHSHGRAAGIYGRLIGKLLHIPVIHTFHGVSYDESLVNRSFSIPLEKYLKQFTTRFVHVSDSEKEYALSLSVSEPDRSLTIHNGIDTTSYQFEPKTRSELRGKLGIQKDDFVIGCVARFDPCKRQEDLILAFYQLTPKKRNLKLVLIGKGETEKRLKQLAKEKALQSQVLFLGEQENIKPYYHPFPRKNTDKGPGV